MFDKQIEYIKSRVDKVMVCNQSGAQRATTRIDTGGTPAERSERQRESGAQALRRESAPEALRLKASSEINGCVFRFAYSQ